LTLADNQSTCQQRRRATIITLRDRRFSSRLPRLSHPDCRAIDRLRQNFNEGTAVLTLGVAALGAEAVARIVKTVAVYDDFCHANDPYEEHDFGSFDADGATIFFKIDYYDKNSSSHSSDPTDPSITKRVITIMLAEEY
jgi:hypothetical protein